MPRIPEVIEFGDSGSGNLVVNPDGSQSRSVILKWLVSGMSGYDAAEAKGKQLAPLILNGHRRVRCEPQVIGGGWYQITAEYANGSIVVDPTDGCLGLFGSWGFDFESGTEHITQAWSDSLPDTPAQNTIVNPNAYVLAFIAGNTDPEGRPATVPIGEETNGVFVPDYRGAIGVDMDQVKGADIPTTSLSWNETWHFPAKLLTEPRPPLKRLGMPDATGQRDEITIEQPPLLDVFTACTAKVNKTKFRGFDVGEVLMGPPRSPQIHAGSSMASVTFHFSRRKNRTNFFVGDIGVSLCCGWDHLDIHYETQSEAAGVVKKPRVVYVVRTIERVDFAQLGIGDAFPTYWLGEDGIGHQFDKFLGEVA